MANNFLLDSSRSPIIALDLCYKFDKFLLYFVLFFDFGIKFIFCLRGGVTIIFMIAIITQIRLVRHHDLCGKYKHHTKWREFSTSGNTIVLSFFISQPIL